MKKYILLVVSALVLAFTSCSDSEDVEITLYEDVTLNVNTSNAFDIWGLSDFENYLGNDKSKSIGITSLVYDENGDLARVIKSHTKTFQTVEQTIENIEEGLYTVVIFETLVNDDDNYESSAWILADEDKLSTLKVTYQEGRSIAYWHECFGVASVTLNVRKDKKVNVKPEPVGCLINLDYENFASSSYNFFSFSSRNNAIGYKLDPAISEADRYVHSEYSASNLWGDIGYFYSGEGVLDDSDGATYFVFQTGNRPYLFGASKDMFVNNKTTFDDDITGTYNFEMGKIHQAFAYYTGGEPAFETYLGSREDFDAWYEQLDKTSNIRPTGNTIYREPCTNWGTSVENVKNYMGQYELMFDVEEDVSGAYSMAYIGLNRELFINYYFETKTSGLYQTVVSVSDTEDGASIDEVLKQLESQSYEFDLYDEETGTYMYESEKTFILVMPIEISDMKVTAVQYVDREYIESMEQTRTTDVLLNMINQSVDCIKKKQLFK